MSCTNPLVISHWSLVTCPWSFLTRPRTSDQGQMTSDQGQMTSDQGQMTNDEINIFGFYFRHDSGARQLSIQYAISQR